MQATIVKQDRESATLKNCRRDSGFFEAYLILTITAESKLAKLVELRLYRTAARVYACIWLSRGDFYNIGGGYAGGYGYCKKSAAAQAALGAAGVTLSESISGRGESAMESALIATAEALGFARDQIHLIKTNE